MDEKKKFKIEFDDDFDSWLAQHEQATKDLQSPAPPLNLASETPAQSAPDIPIQRRAVQPDAAPVQPAQDIPIQRKAPVQPQPAAPVQPQPAAPAQPKSAAPAQPKPAASAQPKSAAPAQPKPAAPVQPQPAAPAQPKPAAPVQPQPAAPAQPKPVASVQPVSPQPKPDSNRFKPIESNSGSDISVSRSEIVKNFKVEINEEEFNKPAYEEPEQPVKRDKSIYFAGRKPAKSPAYNANAQQNAGSQEKKKRVQQTMADQRSNETKQINIIRRFLVFFVIIVSSVLLSTYGISCINDVLALNRSEDLITVTIEKDADYEEIIDVLGDNKLIKHEWFCKLVCKFRGFDKKEYLHGVHYLTANMGVEGMLTEMLANQMSDKTIRLSFPEGWSLPQIIAKLDENNVCPAEYIYAALEEVEFDYGFINSIPEDGARCYALEGYLFPDTYDFFVSEKQNGIGENPTSILNKLLGNFDSRWSEVYTKRAKELNLTMDEVIIIASIIQKEAADKSQMGVVSSVIHNRLNNSSSYPLLECNSTKDYVTNNIVPVIGDAGASSYIVAYDTYNAEGLPPGPICNPGIDAIEAALNPDDTDYLYFCHNEAGKIYLAKTYNQHQSNWAQVLRDNEAD
ncbi:MAG: endolytic transglycosylase MltG [Clostridia bacterium]|nr:endolytic transglycosylase MltG [Clostridia bacterium]